MNFYIKYILIGIVVALPFGLIAYFVWCWYSRKPQAKTVVSAPAPTPTVDALPEVIEDNYGRFSVRAELPGRPTIEVVGRQSFHEAVEQLSVEWFVADASSDPARVKFYFDETLVGQCQYRPIKDTDEEKYLVRKTLTKDAEDNDIRAQRLY